MTLSTLDLEQLACKGACTYLSNLLSCGTKLLLLRLHSQKDYKAAVVVRAHRDLLQQRALRYPACCRETQLHVCAASALSTGPGSTTICEHYLKPSSAVDLAKVHALQHLGRLYISLAAAAAHIRLVVLSSEAGRSTGIDCRAITVVNCRSDSWAVSS